MPGGYLLVQGVEVEPHGTPEGDHHLLAEVDVPPVHNKQLA